MDLKILLNCCLIEINESMNQCILNIIKKIKYSWVGIY